MKNGIEILVMKFFHMIGSASILRISSNIILPGLLLTWLLDQSLWKGFALSNGEEMISFYIGPFAAIIAGTVFLSIKKFSIVQAIFISLLICFIIQLPLYHHLFERYNYIEGGDAILYYKAAKYLYDNQTLCSYDNQILNSTLGNQYLFQPGYKYYLASLLFITNGQLFRAIQFFGGILIVIIILLLEGSLIHRAKNKNPTVALFFIAISAALIKNMLMGLTEWLAILMMALGFVFFCKKKIIYCLVCLGLTVFIRQTFLPIAVLAAILVLIKQPGKKIAGSLTFLFVLSLPLVHNIIYAGKWMYFVDYSWWAKIMGLTTTEYFWFSMIIPYKMVFLQNFGIDLLYFNWINEILAFLFIPICWLAITQGFKQLYFHDRKFLWMLSGVSVLLFLPSIAYNGYACFPRFQMFNFSSLIFLILFREVQVIQYD